MRIVTAMAAVCLMLGGAAHAAGPVPARDTAWSENFDRLDTSAWQVQLYSFPANGCNMRADRVAAAGGTLSLGLALNPARTVDAPKLCNAGEIGSYTFFTYGLFQVRLKAPSVPGAVSAFFLMNPYQPSEWEHREIDIELLGKAPGDIQMTTHDFQNGGRDWKHAATTQPLGFDYSAGFHDYAILWTPDAVTWFVDHKAVHTETQYVPHEPLQIRMNTYLGDPATQGVTQWLGPIDAGKLPAAALYQTISYAPLDALPDWTK